MRYRTTSRSWVTPSSTRAAGPRRPADTPAPTHTHNSLIMTSVKSIVYPPYGSEYPGYLRIAPLVQTGIQSSTPQPAHIGYLLTEVIHNVAFTTENEEPVAQLEATPRHCFVLRVLVMAYAIAFVSRPRSLTHAPCGRYFTNAGAAPGRDEGLRRRATTPPPT